MEATMVSIQNNFNSQFSLIKKTPSNPQEPPSKITPVPGRPSEPPSTELPIKSPPKYISPVEPFDPNPITYNPPTTEPPNTGGPSDPRLPLDPFEPPEYINPVEPFVPPSSGSGSTRFERLFGSGSLDTKA